jgi:DNA-binding HxlR family transcriptional regulator
MTDASGFPGSASGSGADRPVWWRIPSIYLSFSIRVSSVGWVKRYDHYCAVARALDVVGDRWVLLIVRELLAFGPSRYSDLKRGLPGIASNLLADRLKAMESEGLIERREAPAPIGAPLYHLTPRGRDLEDVLRALTRWGLPDMSSGPTRSDAVRPQWTALFAGLTLTERMGAGRQITVGIRTGDASVRATLGGQGRYRIERSPDGHDREPDVTLSGPAHLVGGVLSGLLTVTEAADLGLEIDGRSDLLTDLVGPDHPETGTCA